MQLTFCGAARQVTGSCFLFETGSRRFLVECGMFQGDRSARERNAAPFPFDPRALDFVLLTHAHLDHSGLLPRLTAEGFAGPIYTTRATIDLLGVLLPDSAYLQQVEAERAARHGREYVAIYGIEDARAALTQTRPVAYDQMFDPAAGIRVRLRDAGHILGSAIVELFLDERGRQRKVVISGDLGQPGRAIVRDPTLITEADVLLLESTYGNRDHKPLTDSLDELVTTLDRTLRNEGGVVLVPAFAVGRTQELLYYLNRLSREKRLSGLNVFVDSPMAAEVTAITARHFELFDEEARRLAREDHRDGRSLRLKFTDSVQESMALNRIAGGAIIIAASGMCDGGRIRHHLRHRLPNPHTTVLIIGYQAVGTLGRRLVDRASSVRIFGEDVPVRAQVVTIGGFSAHADQSALLDWLGHLRAAPEQLFLIHGE
ncbi:MAG TPA: MBL fold metallo-hydrolase, partial [Steroidobacteraceae bacterium]